MAFRSTGKASWPYRPPDGQWAVYRVLLAALDHLMAQHRVRRGIRAASRIGSLPRSRAILCQGGAVSPWMPDFSPPYPLAAQSLRNGPRIAYKRESQTEWLLGHVEQAAFGRKKRGGAGRTPPPRKGSPHERFSLHVLLS